MADWKNSKQKEQILPDGRIRIRKADETVRPGARFIMGKNRRVWRILHYDRKKGKLLVITDQPVCQKEFDRKSINCTWAGSTLRKWLNKEFLKTEFSKEEQNAILMSPLGKGKSNNTACAEDKTIDKVFLLSAEEYEKYRQYVEGISDGEKCWLRSYGSHTGRTITVDADGKLFYNELAGNSGVNVCPALWIDLDTAYISASPNDCNELSFGTPETVMEIIVEDGVLVHASEKCTEAEIPAEVKKISANAFENCLELKTFTWAGEMPEFDREALVNCPKLVLPKEFYQGKSLPADSFRWYMPDDTELMVKILLEAHEKSTYWDLFIRRLSVENAAEIADILLARIREIKNTEHCERILRFALAAAPALGKERLTAVQKYLKTVRYTAINWQPLLQRETERTDAPAVIGNIILSKKIVSANILGSDWKELGRLPGFAAVMDAVSDYAVQYSEDSLEGMDPVPDALDYIKNKETDAKIAAMNHSALMSLLRSWAERFNSWWYAPYAAYANDQELAVLLVEIGSWEKKKALREQVIRVRGAVLLNETVTAKRYADERELLSTYAFIHKMDEDDIRDNIISDFGLDAQGKRSWTLAGKTFTAVVNKDLTVTLTDENGAVYSSIPEIGTNLAECVRIAEEFRDLQENILPTAKLRNKRIFWDFLSGRKREAGSWKEAYQEKAVLRILAKLIVWDQNGSTFTMDDSGQAVTADGTPYTVTDAPITVAHPMEMGREATEAWQKYFTDRKLKQPFEQVWEPVIPQQFIKPDRYAGCMISVKLFQNRENDGIYMPDRYSIEFTDCDADVKINRSGSCEIRDFRYDEWTRYVNHIAAYLDKCTVSGRIRKDDISVVQQLDDFTQAQITKFIDIAIEAEAHNVLAHLLEYKNARFGTFDPMKEFTLDL
ncbi:MAG: DUF4132 domain-containing protein [Solobacterium sp.]|nr:DUF4132 domain-containing protein [Solobacterium sp.]